MASTILTRTVASTGNNKILTWSGWVKRSDSSTGQLIFANGDPGSSNYIIFFEFTGAGLRFIIKSLSILANVETNAVFRDLSAYYHLVFNMDTTQATASNRIKMYVNGEQITSFVTASYPSQNLGTQFNNAASVISVGGKAVTGANTDFFNGYMSHVHFIDGTVYGPSTFGETDSLTGIWKPITSPSVTYGTNGFFLNFSNSGSMGTDSSGEGNNLAVTGTLTQTQDTPSNVYATYNPLGNFFPADTFSNGNTTQTTNAGNYTYNISTLGASNGKYYCEIKNSTNNNNSIGIADRPSISTTNGLTGTTYGWAYVMSGQVYNNGSIVATYNTVTTNDIVGIALDLDNNKVYFSKNGTWQGSSDPSAGTGGISITDPASNRTGFYFFGSGDEATNSAVHNANFGNGYFGTTAVASAGTNASGIGIFEYDVPTGYTALSTKGLNL